MAPVQQVLVWHVLLVQHYRRNDIEVKARGLPARMPLAARIIMSVSDDVKMNDCPKLRSARLDCVFTPISSYSRSTPSYFRDSCVSSGAACAQLWLAPRSPA